MNNKVYSATKVSLFIANYGRELKMEADIKRKSGESNRVCKEDKKSSRGSRSGIKKSIKRDKGTSK